MALLIFADRATDHGGLEDYARKKIWPDREPVRRLRPAEFNPIIRELARSHCR